MGGDVASCNALNREGDLCPISNLCESEVGQVIFQRMYFWVCATGKPYQCGECACDFMSVVLGQILCVYATSESTAFVSYFHYRLFFSRSRSLFIAVSTVGFLRPALFFITGGKNGANG